MTLYHETNEELRKIQKRKEIRQALQKEFNRVYYNPRTISQHVEIVSLIEGSYLLLNVSIEIFMIV